MPGPTMESLGMKFPKMFLGDGEKTFQFQGDLPSLPVPPLKQTLDKYLDSVRPHVTDSEYQHTEKLVREFEQADGRDLHERLCAYAKHKRNWLESWWERYAYLTYREPAAPLVNFAGPGPYITDVWPPAPGTQLTRGALIVWLTMQFWQILRKEQLRVDRGGVEKRVWCMYQLHRMFSSCKTPGAQVDQLNDYFKTEAEGDSPHHITVQCRGRIFTMDILDASGEILSPAAILSQLQDIQGRCEREREGPAVGALTALQRTRFFEEREHLLSLHPENTASIETVQTAIINLVLDDAEPQDLEQLTRESLLGNANNRWFDKSFTFIMFKNGTIGCNCDHAPHDAMIMVVQTTFNYMTMHANRNWEHAPHDAMVMIASTYFSLLSVQTIQQHKQEKALMMPAAVPSNSPPPRELVFHVDDRVLSSVLDAKNLYNKMAGDILVNIRIFPGYGRKVIRDLKLVPDTHVQLCMQLAYYRTHGKPAPTYETASTRKYWHGRTETVRSCTPEAVGWAKAMLDANTTKAERLSLYKAAYTKHNTLMAQAQDAQGCDRHLFGLQCVAMEEGLPMPAIYADPAWKKSGGGAQYILSTSFVGYTAVFGGVAPMCTNGYGFFYSIMPDQICFFMAKWTNDTETNNDRLYANMAKTLEEAKELLQYGAAKL